MCYYRGYCIACSTLSLEVILSFIHSSQWFESQNVTSLLPPTHSKRKYLWIQGYICTVQLLTHLNPSTAIILSSLTMLQTTTFLVWYSRGGFPSAPAPWESREAVSTLKGGTTTNWYEAGEDGEEEEDVGMETETKVS